MGIDRAAHAIPSQMSVIPSVEGLRMRFRNYFERVFIINLAERLDRRLEMLQELHAAGLSVEPGHIEFFPAVKAPDTGGFRNAGVHGCFRSHLEALKLSRSEGARNVLILEDDASLSSRFLHDEEILVEQLSQIPWGMTYFGHALEPCANRRTVLRPHAGPILLAHCYAVNASVFDRLIQFLEAILSRPPGDPAGGPMDVDGAFSRFRAENPDVVTLVASPNLATQRNSRSDLSPRWFDRIPGLSNMAGLYRRGRRTTRELLR